MWNKKLLFLLLSTHSISTAFVSPHTCNISPGLQQQSYDYDDEENEKATPIIPIENAQEGRLWIDNVDGVDITMWYQTWGNREGIPVLFVHGGPGQCVADYENINGVFFDKDTYFVVEADQRGTGKSAPSVRDLTPTVPPRGGGGGDSANNAGVEHMRLYRGISIQQMSGDYERLRNHVGVTQWLVFGGSWGLTLGLDYAERYPTACLGLILRGVFLSTEEEMGAVYSSTAMRTLAEQRDDRRYVREFRTFFDVAEREYGKVWRSTRPDRDRALASILGASAPARDTAFPASLDPDDARAMLKLYERLITAGSREATWKFYVFEHNLMEEDESKLLDPENIEETLYAEAQTVSFFEARLFLKGVYESSREEFDLLGSVGALSGVGTHGTRRPVPTWVVQGTGDAVCPDIFARRLATALEDAGALRTAYFVDAGHEATSTGIRDVLITAVDEFHTAYLATKSRA